MIPLLRPQTKYILPFSTIADDKHIYRVASIKLASIRPSVKKKIDQAVATAQHLRIGAIINTNVRRRNLQGV